MGPGSQAQGPARIALTVSKYKRSLQLRRPQPEDKTPTTRQDPNHKTHPQRTGYLKKWARARAQGPWGPGPRPRAPHVAGDIARHGFHGRQCRWKAVSMSPAMLRDVCSEGWRCRQEAVFMSQAMSRDVDLRVDDVARGLFSCRQRCRAMWI